MEFAPSEAQRQVMQICFPAPAPAAATDAAPAPGWPENGCPRTGCELFRAGVAHDHRVA
jgi:hypothetical protein